MSDPIVDASDFEKLAANLADQPVLAAERGPLMQRITLAVLAESQPRTPVRTGTLRRSETTRVDDGGNLGYVYSRVLYAPYVHARVPFFDRGLEAAQPTIERLTEAAGTAYFARIVT